MKNEGWICPKCVMVHNPNVAFCSCSMEATCYNVNIIIGEWEIDSVEKIAKVFENFKK